MYKSSWPYTIYLKLLFGDLRENKGVIGMVLILGGNSEIGAHSSSEICDVICG